MRNDMLRVLQSKQEIRAFYNKISKAYDLLAERSEAPMRRLGLQMLAAAPGEQVLEIGFGTGHCLVELARAVESEGSVHGADLSDEMTRLARKLVKKEGLSQRVHLTLCDAQALPYPDDVMDALFMSFTLELFDTPDLPETLGEFRRVLRPGGRIAIVSMSKEGKEELAVKIYEWTHRHFPNFLDCRPIFVERTLREAGFCVLDVRLEHMWVPVEIVLAKKP